MPADRRQRVARNDQVLAGVFSALTPELAHPVEDLHYTDAEREAVSKQLLRRLEALHPEFRGQGRRV